MSELFEIIEIDMDNCKEPLISLSAFLDFEIDADARKVYARIARR